jgi:hypothetical protein
MFTFLSSQMSHRFRNTGRTSGTDHTNDMLVLYLLENVFIIQNNKKTK